jgi:carboxymethylenebutenolidase
MKGYLVVPKEGGPFGAVIVVHENRGLNAHIKDVTRRMALEGFVALAPDYLSDLGGTPADEDAARGLFGQLEQTDVTANGVATIDWLQAHERSNGKVGAIGFCWGGGTVNDLAVASPELLVAVPYYGRQPDPQAVPAIEAKVLAHYGGLDERINAGIPAFEEALEAAGVEHQIFVYEGANHAFNNDTSAARYDEAAAKLAWERTIGLLKETLG